MLDFQHIQVIWIGNVPPQNMQQIWEGIVFGSTH